MPGRWPGTQEASQGPKKLRKSPLHYARTQCLAQVSKGLGVGAAVFAPNKAVLLLRCAPGTRVLTRTRIIYGHVR